MAKQKDDQFGKERILTNYDDKRRVLHLGEMEIVPPEVGIFDEPTRCYRINKEWASIVMGIVNWLAHPAVWRDADDWTYPAIAEINQFKVGEDCVPQLMVRAHPLEPCELDFSTDGGETWIAFWHIDYCLYGPGTISNLINALSQTVAFNDLIEDIAEDSSDNVLPDLPTTAQPDILCDSAYYITDKVIAFIQQTLDDASTITLQEFLEGLLGIGGFDGSLLKQFWDLIVANSYPDLLSDVTNARHFIARHLYCNELDKELAILGVDADAEIGDEAQAAIIGAINAITDGKWGLWAFVGSQIDSGEDCAGLCPEPQACYDMTNQDGLDFTSGQTDFGFGNDEPSILWQNYDTSNFPINGGTASHQAAVIMEHEYLQDVTIQEIEFDIYNNHLRNGSPGIVGYTYLVRDATDNVLSNPSAMIQNEHSEWITHTFTGLNITGARKVMVYCWASTNANVTGAAWMDNFCITHVEE